MFAFGMVTLFLIMLLFALQSVVLNYFMIVLFSRICFIFVGIDAMLLLHMLSSYNVDLAATRGGVQWLVYSWTLLFKLVIFFWFIFGPNTLADTLIGSVGIYAVLFFTPILYTILSFRSARQLYGNSRVGSISIESMLHADMVVHVMVDLLDLVTAFRYAELPATVMEQSPWIHTLSGSCIVVAIFMHSLSFPTTAATGGIQWRKSQQREQPAHQGDIFLTRKHAALVAMFLVDIPLMIIRTYLWIRFPKNPGLNPFLIKNIIFLPLQAFRLNQCRLAERERAKSSQRVSSINEEMMSLEEAKTGATPPSIKPHRSSTLLAPVSVPTVSEENPAKRSIFGNTIRRRPPPQSPMNKKEGMMSTAMRDERTRSLDSSSIHKNPRGLTDDEVDNNDMHAPAGSRHVAADDELLSDVVPMKVPDEEKAKVEKIIQELKSIRAVPVQGFGFFRLVVKIYHCLRAGTRHGLASLLDENFVLGYWKQVRIALPLVVAWSSQILLVSVTRNFIRSEGPSDLIGWTSWSLVPSDFRFFLYVVSANFGLMFIFWIGTAPFFDVIFVTLFWSVRLTSFYLSFTTVRDTRALDFTERWHARTEHILIWMFILIPCFRLLDGLYCIQGAFLGRKYMYFIVPSPNRALHAGLLNMVSNFRETQFSEDKKTSRSDESGWVTTSSVLVFLNCRNSLAPISFGELLIGPDLIKDVRLMDMMVLRSWLETLMHFLSSCIMLMLFFSFVNLGVFTGQLVMRIIYNIFIQAIRLLSLRRYEVKILFEEIVRAWGDTGSGSYLELVAADQDDENEENERGISQRIRQRREKRFISLLDVTERYQRHGFFTSPGDLFPSFY